MHLMDELTLDRRSRTRAVLSSTIGLRPIGGVNHEVALHDLSASGCCVEVVESIEPGEPVIARFPQLEPIVGELRWVRGPVAGLAFNRPMHEAVFYDVLGRLS
jgi:hypothetical protein